MSAIEQTLKFSLKELRARHNETQAETANALGISQTSYNYWENNISKIAIGKVIAIADHFGVTLDQIQL